jgi:hypothetical protein
MVSLTMDCCVGVCTTPRAMPLRSFRRGSPAKAWLVAYGGASGGEALQRLPLRVRSSCKVCGGSSIFEHSYIRSRCTICGGGSICEHNRRRSECKICVGGSICEHNRQTRFCKICGGSAVCHHMRRKYSCKDCAAQAASAP